MKLTPWDINKDTGQDTCELQLDDGRTFISFVRKRRGNKTGTATMFNDTVLFSIDQLPRNEFLPKLLECLKDTWPNLRTKFKVTTPNMMGYTATKFLKEMRIFIMSNDPNCMVDPRHFPK